MKEFGCREDLANGLKVAGWQIQQAEELLVGHGYFYVGDIQVRKHFINNQINFVIVEDDEDCKQYIMAYFKNLFKWKVYVDDLEGWQDIVEIKDITNTGMNINRATVTTAYGTQLNRVVKYVDDEEEIIPDRCIYFYEEEV